MNKLIERIDKALQVAGKTRPELAKVLGVTQQNLSNLSRRPGSSLSPERLLKTATFLSCSLEWLVTGEGGEYVAASNTRSSIAVQVSEWVMQMDPSTQSLVFKLVFQLKEGADISDILREHSQAPKPLVKRIASTVSKKPVRKRG